jgi:DNA-directed RNA polymerase specialized sigma24 family protein
VGLLAQDAYRRIEEIPAEKGLPTLAEYAAADDCPLLRSEWNIICRRAHLTEDQQRAFTWYHIHGMSLRDSAAIMECDESTVRYHLQAAYSRLRRVHYQGLLTVLIETFGLSDVMQAMEEK